MFEHNALHFLFLLLLSFLRWAQFIFQVGILRNDKSPKHVRSLNTLSQFVAFRRSERIFRIDF